MEFCLPIWSHAFALGALLVKLHRSYSVYFLKQYYRILQLLILSLFLEVQRNHSLSFNAKSPLESLAFVFHNKPVIRGNPFQKLHRYLVLLSLPYKEFYLLYLSVKKQLEGSTAHCCYIFWDLGRLQLLEIIQQRLVNKQDVFPLS